MTPVFLSLGSAGVSAPNSAPPQPPGASLNSNSGGSGSSSSSSSSATPRNVRDALNILNNKDGKTDMKSAYDDSNRRQYNMNAAAAASAAGDAK